MALIKCPECGKEISDQSTVCIGCGFPIRDYLAKKMQEEQRAKLERERFKCKRCGFQNETGSGFCANCGNRLIQAQQNAPVQQSGFVRSYSQQQVNQRPMQQMNQRPPQQVNQRPPQQFNGIYRYTMFGEKKEVYCPRCKSSNCSHYQEQKVVPGKTKTRYTANLNPLHPFTLVNKKEKVKREEKTVTESKFICNSCGKIFY